MSIPYETFSVDAARRTPLLNFMLDSLRSSGCTILHRSPDGEAPFRISFLTPWGERMGIVAYAFLANSRPTRNRPGDEHRFQVKYGSKDGKLHQLWQDPYGLYTTICIGINPDRGFFVGVDPVLNSPTLFYISREFKQHHVDRIAAEGWHAWERFVRPRRADAARTATKDPSLFSEDGTETFSGHEVLIGATADNFLRYVLFEREVLGEDQGHRQLVAEQYASTPQVHSLALRAGSMDSALVPVERLHSLEREFELPSEHLMELIARAPRLKMAVRGWVAEQHLKNQLQGIPSIEALEQIEADGQPDFEVRMRGGTRPVRIECKNVLRAVNRDGWARLDFMKTRASPTDPCSRYYKPEEFDIVAACLHARTERWEFVARRTSEMEAHQKCVGRLHHRVQIDDAWSSDLEAILQRAARAA